MATQYEIALIHHEVQNVAINQRAIDGYVNATAMCQVAGKLFADYRRLNTTQAFLEALNADMGIPISELIQQVKGGVPALQGTWVHPQVAINLGQWLSPEFAVKVSRWVFEWISGGQVATTQLPDHVRRYIVNQPKIPATHFSMLNQMMLRILAPLEAQGYILPPRLMPDIALGRMFSIWCREQGHDPDNFPTYRHEFVDHRRDVNARLYPNALLTEFNIEMEKWLRDGKAHIYFSARDKTAIEPLQQAIALLPPPTET